VIGLVSKARYHAASSSRDDRGVAEGFARVRVGEVHLYERRSRLRHNLARIAQGVGVVGKCRGVENHRGAGVRGLVEPTNERCFVITLPKVQCDVRRKRLVKTLLNVRQCLRPVDIWFPRP